MEKWKKKKKGEGDGEKDTLCNSGLVWGVVTTHCVSFFFYPSLPQKGFEMVAQQNTHTSLVFLPAAHQRNPLHASTMRVLLATFLKDVHPVPHNNGFLSFAVLTS